MKQYIYYIDYEIKFPVLKRPKNDTVGSFRRWFDLINHFPWLQPNEYKYTVHTPQPAYDGCYPQYSFGYNETFKPSLELSSGKFWDEYYTWVDLFIQKYPNKFQIFSSYELFEKEEEQLRLFNLIGLPEPHSFGAKSTHKTKKD